MARRICYFLIATLQVISWVAVTSRPLALYDAPPQPGEHRQVSQATLDVKQKVNNKEEMVRSNGDSYRVLSRLGSRPPNCAHKCGGCIPCYAIQIPATSDQLGVQYANYEPEGWKCKCGTSFFNP